jgi:peptidoglycan hydrolase-like protein with peptidoglycan-binding domain
MGAKTNAAIVTVKKGAKSNLTWILQAALYIVGFNPGTLDSKFGTNTENVLKKLQVKKGLYADGKAGQKTFKKLIN